MNKNIQRDEDRQIQVPNVFKDKTEGEYMLIKKRNLKTLWSAIRALRKQ